MNQTKLVKTVLNWYNIHIARQALTREFVQVLVLGGVITATFFYVDIRYVLKGQLERRAQAGKQVRELRKSLVDLRAAQKRIGGLSQSQLEAQKSKLAAGGTLITEDGIVALLQEISEKAARYHVRINHIKPAKEAGTEQGLKPLSITLDGMGEFHNAVALINDLEAGAFFIAVQAVKVTPQKDVFRQKIHLVLRTYVE